jgi:hypothetical protein
MSTVQIFGGIVTFANYGAIGMLAVDVVYRLWRFGPTVLSDGNKGIEKTQQPGDPFYYMLTFQLIPLTLLMLAAQTEYMPVLKYIEFIKGPAGKGAFFIFVSLLLFDPLYKFDMVIAIVITLIGLLNIIHALLSISCGFGGSEKEQEEI